MDAYLKKGKIIWEELTNTLKQAPATSISTPFMVAITTTSTTTTITAANQQAEYNLQNHTGQSSTSICGTENVDPVVTKDGLNLD